MTGSQWLSSKNPSQTLFLLITFLIIILNRKWLLLILVFLVLYTLSLILVPFIISDEINYLKSLALSRRYNASIIEKTLYKIRKSKRFVCFFYLWFNPVVLHIYSSIFFSKSLISFLDLASKSPFSNLLTKLCYFLLKAVFLLVWYLFPLLFFLKSCLH